MHKLEELMKEVNGASFIGIDTETVVKLKGGQSNPLQGHVTKLVTGSNVMVFTNAKTNGYDAMVRRRLEAEGRNPNSFNLSPRAWGVRRQGEPFVDHKGQTYLEVIFLKAGEVQYYVDGKPVDANFLSNHGLELDKEEGKQGGLNNKVIIRTYHVDSIKKITINNQKFAL